MKNWNGIVDRGVVRRDTIGMNCARATRQAGRTLRGHPRPIYDGPTIRATQAKENGIDPSRPNE